MNSKKALIVYHEVKPGVACSDGIAAAWIAQRGLLDEGLDTENIYLVGCCYNGEPPFVAEYDQVYIVDFSFPASLIESWAIGGRKIVLIDHHKTALQNLEGLTDKVLKKFDMEECGATLTWRYFYPACCGYCADDMPIFLKYVRDRDLWHKKLPHTEEIHEAISKLKYGLKPYDEFYLQEVFALFDRLKKMSEQELFDYLLPIGEPIMAAKRAKIEEVASRAQQIYFQGNTDWDIFSVDLLEDGSEDRLTSDVCAFLYKKYPQVPFVACYLPSSQTWSLRSDKNGNNTDVSAIAKAFGGGGHHNASGFKAIQGDRG